MMTIATDVGNFGFM